MRVYFVQESGTGAIKIGVAKDVKARMASLGTGTPHVLTVLGVIDGDVVLEETLHEQFRHARIRGEWFRPVPELLEYIATKTRLE
jgi:hypothetical protein